MRTVEVISVSEKTRHDAILPMLVGIWRNHCVHLPRASKMCQAFFGPEPARWVTDQSGGLVRRILSRERQYLTNVARLFWRYIARKNSSPCCMGTS